jgi:hypothetical protein
MMKIRFFIGLAIAVLIAGCSGNAQIITPQDERSENKDAGGSGTAALTTENVNENGESGGSLELNEPYDPEIAAQNGDVINIHRDIRNLDKWEQFVENVNAGTEDEVRVAQYSIEGVPYFYELVYKEGVLYYRYNSTYEAFASGRTKLNACTGIETRQNNNGGEFYALTDCETDSGRSFSFPKIR